MKTPSILWLALFLSTTVHAHQEQKRLSQYIHRQWDYKQGLPQVTVKALLQDAAGYLWVGTQEGLVCFDGVTMTLHDRQQKVQLASDFVYDLYTHGDQLWVGTRRQPFYIERGRFHTFTREDNVPDVTIYSIVGDTSQVYLGTQRGLYTYNGQRFRVHPAFTPLMEKRVNSLLFDRQQRLWAGSMMGLNVLSPGAAESLQIDSEPVNCLYEARDGRLWVGTYDGLYQLDPVSMKVQFFDLPGETINKMAEDSDGIFWVGTNKGIRRYRKGERLRKEGHIADAFHVLTLFPDKEGNLWMGTQANGLHQFRKGKIWPLGEPEGLPPFSVRAVIQARDNSIWAATRGGVVHLSDDAITHIDESSGLSDNDTKCLLEDDQGVIWVGCFYGGINRIQDGRVVEVIDTVYTNVRTLVSNAEGNVAAGTMDGLILFDGAKPQWYDQTNGLSGSRVYSVMPNGNELWLGISGVGIDIFENGVVKQTIREEDGLAGNVVFNMMKRPDGSIWFSTESGITRLKNGRFHSLKPADGLSNALVYRTLEDHQGRFWMSCNKGIFSVDRTEVEAFMDGKVAQVESRFFDRSDGLRSPECNFGGLASSMRDKHDRIWFPTVAGMVYFRPEALMGRHPESPPLLIERVHAADSTFRGFELPARLPPGLDHLDIDYNAPHFSTPERLHFQFQLEGFEEKWHETSTRRTAYYTNIPPGDYRFRLKVALSDGPWHELSPWAFEVEPFFYQRPAVHFTIAMLFLLLGFALHRIRLKRHTASEARLSQLVDTRTRELTELNQRLLNTREELMKTALQSGRAEVANNVVHNLGNALNSINVTMSLLEDDARALELERLSKLVTLLEVEGHEPNFFEENGKGQLAIRALAKLNRRLLSGRDKLTTDLGTLNEQLMHQNRIIRAQQNQVDHVDGFTETIDPNELIDELLVLNSPPGRVRVHKNYHDMPQLKLQRGRLSQTLFHLFNNAWESMNAVDREGLELQIKTYMNGEKLHIELMDNGEGIEQDHLNRIFFHGFTTRPYSDGFGLHYCANTVREMGGSLQITSDGRDRGVRVHLEVPYQRA